MRRNGMACAALVNERCAARCAVGEAVYLLVAGAMAVAGA